MLRVEEARRRRISWVDVHVQTKHSSAPPFHKSDQLGNRHNAEHSIALRCVPSYTRAHSFFAIAFPGIDLPLRQSSELPTEGAYGNWHKRAIPLTVRERVMLDLMAALKNKQGWERKIFDNSIVDKWRAEALAAGDSWRTRDESQTGEVEGLAPAANSRQRVVSEAMFQYVGDCGRLRVGMC